MLNTTPETWEQVYSGFSSLGWDYKSTCVSFILHAAQAHFKTAESHKHSFVCHNLKLGARINMWASFKYRRMHAWDLVTAVNTLYHLFKKDIDANQFCETFAFDREITHSLKQICQRSFALGINIL